MKKLLLLLSVFMMPTTNSMARLRALTAQAQVYMPTIAQQSVKPSTVKTFATKAGEELKTATRFSFVPKTTAGKIGAGLAVAVTGAVAGVVCLDAHPVYTASLISNSAFLLNQAALIKRLCRDEQATNILAEGTSHFKHMNIESIRSIVSHCSPYNKVRIAEAIKDNINMLNDAQLVKEVCTWESADVLAEGAIAHAQDMNINSIRLIVSYCSPYNKVRITKAIKDNINILNDVTLVQWLFPVSWGSKEIEDVLAESVIAHAQHMNIDSIGHIISSCSLNNRIHIAQVIKNNIRLLNNNELVVRLCGSDSKVAKILVDSITAYPEQMNTTSVKKIFLTCSASKRIRIAHAIKNNIRMLNDVVLVENMSRCPAGSADILVDSIIAHHKQMNINSMRAIAVQCSHSNRIRIAQAIITGDIAMFDNALFIGILCHRDEKIADIMALHALKNMDLIPEDVLGIIIGTTRNESLKNKMLKMSMQRFCSHESGTPSCAHIAQAGADDRIKMLANHSSQVRAALQQEETLHKEGLHCFYHGQESKWGLQQDLTQDIVVRLQQRGIVQDELPADFRYIMNKNILLDSTTDERAVVTQELQRHDAIYHGPTYFGGGAARTGLLFVNKFAHGRVQESGSYTAEYVKSNYNVKSNPLDFQSVFSALTVPELHEKYKKELEELEQMHNQLFKSGRLLQICVPEAMVDDVVRMKYGGVKTTRGKMLTKIPSFINKVQQGPGSFIWRDAVPFEDLDKASEMVIPLTSAYLLNPHSGIKIFAYDAEPADKELHATYVAQRKALAEKIAYDAAQQLHGKKFTLCCKTAAARLKEAAQALGK